MVIGGNGGVYMCSWCVVVLGWPWDWGLLSGASNCLQYTCMYISVHHVCIV